MALNGKFHVLRVTKIKKCGGIGGGGKCFVFFGPIYRALDSLRQMTPTVTVQELKDTRIGIRLRRLVEAKVMPSPLFLRAQ